MLPLLGRLPTSTKPPKFRPSRHPFRRRDIYPSRVRPERRATFRMPSDETLRITLVCMLPLLHFSRFRVAVPSSSAPAFGAFAPGSSCHQTDPQTVRFRRRLVSRFPVGSGRFSGMIATPRSLTNACTPARPSRSAARTPSYFRASRFRPVTGALELPRRVLTLTDPAGATGPFALSWSATPSICMGRYTHCVLSWRSADRTACALACARASAAPLRACQGTMHLKDGTPRSLSPPWSGAATSGPLFGCRPNSPSDCPWRRIRVTPVALSPRGFRTQSSSLSQFYQARPWGH